MRSRFGHKEKLPSGSWRITVTNGLRVDGYPRRIRETYATEALADARLAELALVLGREPEYGKGVTLSDYWTYYAATKGARLARSTLEKYTTLMRGAWLPALGERDITAIARRDVQAVILQACSASNGRDRKRALSAVLSQAVADGVLRSNPCAGAPFEYPGDVGRRLDTVGPADPFAALESAADVWTAADVLRAMPRIEGTTLETCWLLMIGGGLRLQEALALTWRDVRVVDVAGRSVVQVAVYRAYTRRDGMHKTKGTRSDRVAVIAEPFGARLWALRGDDAARVCTIAASYVSRSWRKMWVPLSGSPYARIGADLLRGLMAEPPAVPFVPLSRMRATHATLMQQAGVLDSINAAVHGHSQRVSYKHYQRGDAVGAAVAVGDLLSA